VDSAVDYLSVFLDGHKHTHIVSHLGWWLIVTFQSTIEKIADEEFFNLVRQSRKFSLGHGYDVIEGKNPAVRRITEMGIP